MTLVIRVGGVLETIAALRELPRLVRGRLMRVALNAGGGVLRDAAVSNAPKETGLLKKSLKVKVVVPELSHNPAHHGNPARAIIGTSRDVVGFYRRTKTGRLRGIAAANREFRISRQLAEQAGVSRRRSSADAARFVLASFGGAQLRRPSRYAHLVEKGTKPHSIGAQSHPGTKASRFLARAVQSKGDSSQIKIIQKLQEGIANWSSARAAKVRGVNPFQAGVNPFRVGA